MFAQKYARSGGYYDPKTVENYLNEAIRYDGTDPPLMEADMPRASNNPLSQSVLSVRHNGARYSHAPFHPELFLGDLTKDARGSEERPRMGSMRDQHLFRHARYLEGKLQDVGDTRAEGVIGPKQMLRNVKGGFNDRAARMAGIFRDSVPSFQQGLPPTQRSVLLQVGDSVKEEMKHHRSDGEMVQPKYGTDFGKKIANQLVPQWQAQPDGKAGSSSETRIFSVKPQGVDQSKRAAERLGRQDGKFQLEQFAPAPRAPKVLQLNAIKRARMTTQESFAAPRGRDSQEDSWRQRLLPPAPVAAVSYFAGTQKKPSDHMESAVLPTPKRLPPADRSVFRESLVEPIKLAPQMESAVRPATVPTQDRVTIVRQANRTHKGGIRSEDTSRQRKIKMLVASYIPRPVGQHKTKETHEATTYSVAFPRKEGLDQVSNVELTEAKLAMNQIVTRNATATNTLPVPKITDDFKFDIDPTMDNAYFNQRGATQKFARYTRMPEMDSQISPLSDLAAPMQTKYHNKAQ